MNELDPNAPGELTVNLICGDCGTDFSLSREIGNPPKPGRYTFSGNCPECGKAALLDVSVAEGPLGQG